MFGFGKSNSRKSSSSSFGSRTSSISHSSMHDHKHQKDFHKSIHDHKKIHEGMHFGKDKVTSPFNNNFHNKH